MKNRIEKRKNEVVEEIDINIDDDEEINDDYEDDEDDSD